MQPIIAQLPDRCSVPLLLRHLDLHAAVPTVLRASLFGAADTPKPNANLPAAPAFPMPAGLRKGL
jgi:hypothetical protein